MNVKQILIQINVIIDILIFEILSNKIGQEIESN